MYSDIVSLKKHKMKDHAIFVGKVVVGVIVGLMVYNWLKGQMDAKKAVSTTGPATTPTVTETVTA